MSWADKFKDADAGLDTVVEEFERKDVSQPHQILQILEARANRVLQLYNSRFDKTTLSRDQLHGFRREIRGLAEEERFAIYTYLRDTAMLYKMVSNYKEWDRRLEAAEYLKTVFKLKVRE